MTRQAKKKILIFGPIGDVGGREVEVNIIARALCRDFDVRIFSTFYITAASDALKGLDGVDFSSVQLGLFRKYPLIRFFSYLKYWADGRKRQPYAYVKNRLWLRIYKWRQLKLDVIKAEIDAADMVLACVQPSSQYLGEALALAKQKGIPFLVRTTGTIREMNRDDIGFLRDATLHIHHSESNAANLNRQIALPYAIIDQCALFEKPLLSLPFDPENEVFGYAGRLSEEKGILPLIDFFAAHPQYRLCVAGSGPLHDQIAAKVETVSNIELLGQFESADIALFFGRISCLVIPSFEESGPLVGLEAMAAGRLIISTRVGAMAERLQGTGNDWWLETGSLSGIENAITTILSLSPDRKLELSAAVRHKYQQHYTMSVVARQYVSLVKRFFINTAQ